MAAIIRPGVDPRTLQVGGIRRSSLIAVAVGLVLVVGAIGWASNFEPLGVDDTAIGVKAHGALLSRVHANSPTGEGITEYRIRHEAGGRLAFSFYLHNSSPLPVRLTSAGPDDGRLGLFRIDDVEVRDTRGPRPTAVPGPPVSVPADGYVELILSGHFVGCLEEGSTITFGQVPVSFRLLGFVGRHATITMPMAISVTGHRGAACPAA